MMSDKDLLEELVLDILLRLPMKSTVRFRCVSKSWDTLLSSPDFMYKSLHYLEKDKYSHFMLIRRDCTSLLYLFSLLSRDSLDLSVPTKTLPNPVGFDYTHRESWDVDIVGGCCNGLFCVVSLDLIEQEGGIFLWNPATSETKVVPKLEAPRSPNTVEDRHFLGFGFDASTNDYKIVRVTGLSHGYCRGHYGCPENEFEVAVFSLKNGSWKIIDTNKPFLLLFCQHHSCCTGTTDTVYWEAELNIMYHKREHAVVSFNMSSEELKATPLPEKYMFSYEMCSLFSLHKSLAMTAQRENSFDIWALFDAGVEESWTKLLTVAGSPELRAPLGFRSSGDLFFQTPTGGLLTINPITQERRDVQVDGDTNNFQIVPYMATQASLEGSN